MNGRQIEILAHHSRAARAMLRWSRAKLAFYSQVSTTTISSFEDERSRMQARTMRDIVRAFEAAGIVFLDDGTPTLRLAPPATLAAE